MKIDSLFAIFLRTLAVVFVVFAVLALGAAVFQCLYYPTVWGFLRFGLTDGLAYICTVVVGWCICEFLCRTCFAYEKYEPFLLSVVSLVVSCAAVYLSCKHGNLQQVSDSAAAMRSLMGSGVSYAHANVVYWRNYEVFISALSILFSDRVLVSLLVNSVCSAAIVYPVYRTVQRMYGGRTARMIALLVGVSPSFVLYAAHLSGEFLAVTLLIYAAYFSWRSLTIVGDSGRFMLWMAGSAGLLLGLSHLFKPISVIYFAAMGLSCFLIGFASRQNYLLRRGGIVIGIMLACFFGAKGVGQALLNQPVAPTHLEHGSALCDGFVKGLNIKSCGEYEPELAKKLLRMSPAEEWAYFKEVVARDYREYPRLFAKKFCRLYGWPGHYVYKYAHALRTGGSRMPPVLIRMVKGEQVFFRLAFCLGAVGFLVAVWTRRDAWILLPGLVSALVVMMFTALLFVFESAIRYKTSIYPFYFMVLAYSVELFRRMPSVVNATIHIGKAKGAPFLCAIPCALCAILVYESEGEFITLESHAGDLVIQPMESDINFAMVAGKLSPGYRYRFECKDIIVDKGVVDCVDIRLCDRITRINYEGRTFRVDPITFTTGSCQWEFVVPDKYGDYQIRLYAGRIGKARGIGLRCVQSSVNLVK